MHRDPKTGRFISTKTKDKNTSTDNKLLEMIKTLENKVQALESQLSRITIEYDTAIDWQSEDKIINECNICSYRSYETKALPYNTVLKISGTLKVKVVNEKTGDIYCEHKIWDERRIDPGHIPPFTYFHPNTEFILIPAGYKAIIKVDSRHANAHVFYYACLGSKKQRLAMEVPDMSYRLIL